MKKIAKIMVLTFLLASIVLASTGISQAVDYSLTAGDILNIGVWGYEDMQVKEQGIRPDGKIQFPPVGEVQAAGLSPAELKNSLTTALVDYVHNPKVTVNVFKFHTTRIYVLGEVAKPGMYEIEKQHNVLDAIGLAGSYTKDAAKKTVFIIRKDQTGEPVKANLMNLLKKGDMSQNYVLGDGDVVYLTGNGRIDFSRDILPYITAAYYTKNTVEN